MPSFLLALQFLTRLPVSINFQPQNAQWGQSVAWFPAVGALLGLLLVAIAWVFSETNLLALAAVLVISWALFTGGLHIDGLADAADAWAGGIGDPQRSLEIMKDPRSGAIGILWVVLVLLAKFTGLHAVLNAQALSVLLITPILARCGILAMFLSCPYLRSQGIGAAFVDYLPRRLCAVIVLLALFVAVPVLGFFPTFALVVVWLCLYQLSMQRLGGITGDILGATCEISEAIILLAWAIS